MKDFLSKYKNQNELFAYISITIAVLLYGTTLTATKICMQYYSTAELMAIRMLISAMLAVAYTTNDIEEIIQGGLNEIPKTSRLFESVTQIINYYKSGKTQKECFSMIHEKYDETNSHDWCHTISNAMIVVASLLYGKGDFGKSICLSVETGFDTDCNGATVGSILGLANGITAIPEYWQKPINNKIHTSIFGIGTVNILDFVEKTVSHIEK